MRNIDPMWAHLPIDRASTPIQKRSSFIGPRTSTPIITINSIQRSKKKKKKKKKCINNDHRLLFHGQQNKIIQKKRHSFVQIWFL
jgi:hypothetical protein